MYTLEKRVGFGCTLGVDYSGNTSFGVIANIIDGDKMDAKWKVANTSLLSDKADTYSKTSYAPGTLKFTIAYDPLNSDYTNLKTAFLAVNQPAPNWQVSFPDAGTGNGSGATTDTFYAHVVGLSREVKKDSFLVCEIELQLTGGI